MAPSLTPHRWLTVLAVAAIVLVSAAVRLHNLEASTIGHIEIYVPGIDLPYDLSDPRPRLSVASILTGTVAAEPHPPGYYLFMFGWTKCFGTSVRALRLPSVLFGVGSVALLYLLGIFAADRTTALIAAGFLALNGASIYWSQIAKMYSMACCLGLLSTVLLLSVDRVRAPWQRLTKIAYTLTMLAGLATVVYVWPIFLTHLVWVVRGDWSRRQRYPDLLRLILLVFVLATPLWALAAYQSQRPSYLETKVLTGVASFLQLGFLAEPAPFVDPPQIPEPLLYGALLATGALLFAFGLSRGMHDRPAGAQDTGDWPVFLIPAAGVVAALACVAFALAARAMNPARTPIILACAAIPLVLVGLDTFFQHRWAAVRQGGLWLNRKLPRASGAQRNSLMVSLAVLPVAVVVAASVKVPLFASSGVLLYVPYALLVMASGLVWLCRHSNRGVAMGGVLVTIGLCGAHVWSVRQFSQHLRHPVDYQALAQRWLPEMMPSDIIFTRRHWALTPIFYYVDAKRHHFVGRDFADALRQHGTARVWVVSTDGIPMTPEMSSALQGYEARRMVESLRIRAALYEPPPPPA